MSLIFKNSDDSEIKEYYLMIETLEFFLESIRNHDILRVRSVLNDLRDGKVLIMEEGKHKKMLNQLEQAWFGHKQH